MAATNTQHTCTRCGETKARTEFHKRKRATSGLSSSCKPCTAIAARATYERHRAKRLTECAAYRAEHREERKAYFRDHYSANKADYRKREAAWREANRDEHNAYHRAYYAADLEGSRSRHRVYSLTRRGRERDQFIEQVDPQTVYDMHGGRCGICAEFIEGDFHVDHVVPLARGGMHGYVNVQPAHPACNVRKGARLESELSHGCE